MAESAFVMTGSLATENPISTYQTYLMYHELNEGTVKTPIPATGWKNLCPITSSAEIWSQPNMIDAQNQSLSFTPQVAGIKGAGSTE